MHDLHTYKMFDWPFDSVFSAKRGAPQYCHWYADARLALSGHKAQGGPGQLA